MAMTRLMIQLTERHKKMLACLRKDGYSASAYLRRLLQLDLEAWTDVAEYNPVAAKRDRPALTAWVLAKGTTKGARGAEQKER